jgi:DNA gyrase subunit A
MSVVVHGSDPDVFVVFENGLAKRSLASEYAVKGRGIQGVRVAQLSERGGDLVGALTVDEEDEVMVVMEKGKIVRSRVDEVRRTGRNTMGVQFATPDRGDAIVAVARNADRRIEVVLEVDLDDDGPDDDGSDENGQDENGNDGADIALGTELTTDLTTDAEEPIALDSVPEGGAVAGSVASDSDPDSDPDDIANDPTDDNAGGSE